MILKKKKKNTTKIEEKEKTEEKEVKQKRTKKPAEGSKYTALILLFVTVLVSVGFYLFGLWSQKGIRIEFGETNNTWEYVK
jgi:hypothetical protein